MCCISVKASLRAYLLSEKYKKFPQKCGGVPVNGGNNGNTCMQAPQYYYNTQYYYIWVNVLTYLSLLVCFSI